MTVLNEKQQKVLELVSQAAIYVPVDCEGIRLEYWDTEETDEGPELFFYGTGEETGEQYQISYDEVDLEQDMFYKLVAMNG